MIFRRRKERVAVYIDGSNTYNKLKSLDLPEKTKRFDFSAFVNHLVSERELISKRYYVGIVKNYDNSENGNTHIQE